MILEMCSSELKLIVWRLAILASLFFNVCGVPGEREIKSRVWKLMAKKTLP